MLTQLGNATMLTWTKGQPLPEFALEKIREQEVALEANGCILNDVEFEELLLTFNISPACKVPEAVPEKKTGSLPNVKTITQWTGNACRVGLQVRRPSTPHADISPQPGSRL